MRQFTLKHLLLSVVLISVGCAGIGFSLRPTPPAAEFSSEFWYEWRRVFQKSALVLGGVCIALGLFRCVTTRRPTPILIQTLVGVLIGVFVGYFLAKVLVPEGMLRQYILDEHQRRKALVVWVSVALLCGIATPLLIEAGRRQPRSPKSSGTIIKWRK